MTAIQGKITNIEATQTKFAENAQKAVGFIENLKQFLAKHETEMKEKDVFYKELVKQSQAIDSTLQELKK